MRCKFVLFLILLFVPQVFAVGPEVVLFSDETIVDLGSTSKVIVSVKNVENSRPHIEINLVSEPTGGMIQNWIWFEGHRYDASRTNLTLWFDPYEKKNLVFNVMAGLTGDHEINITATDELLNTGIVPRSLDVKVVIKQHMFYNEVPGISGLAVFLMLVIALVGVFRHNK